MEGESEEDAEFEGDFQVNYGIKIIEGMDSACAELLKNAGIKTIEDLLRMGATEPERQHLAKKVEVTYAILDRCVCRGDLIRTRGIGKKYAVRAHGTAFQHTTDLT